MEARLINTFRKANRPAALAADKAYSSKSIRDYIAKMDIEHVIPRRSNEIANQHFNRSKYKKRNIVERAIGWIKEHRRIATRYEKNVENDIAMIQLAIARMIIKRIAG
jgi:transposase